MIVIWDKDQAEPWVVMTDTPPVEAGVCWYGLRFWIELGLRVLGGNGRSSKD